MLYLCLFCLNLSYKSLVVHNSGGGVVPNSVVYKYSDPPCKPSVALPLPSRLPRHNLHAPLPRKNPVVIPALCRVLGGHYLLAHSLTIILLSRRWPYPCRPLAPRTQSHLTCDKIASKPFPPSSWMNMDTTDNRPLNSYLASYKIWN